MIKSTTSLNNIILSSGGISPNGGAARQVLQLGVLTCHYPTPSGHHIPTVLGLDIMHNEEGVRAWT